LTALQATQAGASDTTRKRMRVEVKAEGGDQGPRIIIAATRSGVPN